MKFRVAPVAAASAAAFLLVSCGGESGKPTPPPGTPPVGQAPPPTLSTSLSQDAVEVVVEEGGSATFSFDATYTGSSDDPVVADSGKVCCFLAELLQLLCRQPTAVGNV